MALIEANILEWAARYEGDPFHALLCDPPYHLTERTPDVKICVQCQRVLGGSDGKPLVCPRCGGELIWQRSQGGRGFMGKTWDGGRIAFEPETWAALAQLLYPGAFGMAFAGSRGWHRMACAIEDAGLIIHPTVFCWSYGSGFPKATRIDTQIDRKAGAERATVGTKKHAPKFAAAELGYREKDNGYNSKERESFALTAPATELAQAWEGYRYGLQALKPAVEPVIVFQKPYERSAVESIAQTGAGALWIDGGRVGINPGQRTNGSHNDVYGDLSATGGQSWSGSENGRWPANFALVHHPLCNGVCHEDCAVARLGAQSGESTSPKTVGRGKRQEQLAGLGVQYNVPAPGDTGTAARFFFQADWMLDRLETADPVGYYAKASSAEREAGLDPLQIKLMRDLYGDDLATFDEATINDGREKSIDNAYQRGETTRRNIHPTIKPLSLARWLATLLLPPDLYAPRRLLVPFAGTGSEMIGAALAGWDEITGIELDAQHVAIGHARLRYWEQQKSRFDQGQPISVKVKRDNANQANLFDDEAA